MENRRKDYRFLFALKDRRPVECKTQTGAVMGEMVDLSVQGMRVRLHDGWVLRSGEEVVLNFVLETQLSIPARIVHTGSDGQEVGLHFLPIRKEDARSRAIWTFLLAEQRKTRSLEVASTGKTRTAASAGVATPQGRS